MKKWLPYVQRRVRVVARWWPIPAGLLCFCGIVFWFIGPAVWLVLVCLVLGAVSLPAATRRGQMYMAIPPQATYILMVAGLVAAAGMVKANLYVRQDSYFVLLSVACCLLPTVLIKMRLIKFFLSI